MESPITHPFSQLLLALERMRPSIIRYARQMKQLHDFAADEPVHVAWKEGQLNLRATCDLRTGELLAVAVQPLPTLDQRTQAPALDLQLKYLEELDPAQVALEL